MNFLLELPGWLGLLIVVFSITLTGLVVVTQVKKIIASRLTKQHEKVGRILFRVTAGLIALLISLSYANERMEQYKLIDSMESEASLIVNATIKLNMLPSKEALKIKKKLIQYVNATIDNHWGNVKNNPFYSRSTEFLHEIMNLVYDIPVNNLKEEKIKNDIIEDMNQVTKLMQLRMTLSRKVCKLKFIGFNFSELNPIFKYSQKLV